MTTKPKNETGAVVGGGWHLGPRDRDILSGSLVTFFASLVFFGASDLPKGAAGFPKGIAIVVALSGVLLILRSFRMPRTRDVESRRYSWNLFVITVPLWCASVWLIRPLDFFIVAPIFMAILSWMMSGAPRTAVGLLRAVTFGIVVSVGVWGIFVRVLGVSLP